MTLPLIKYKTSATFDAHAHQLITSSDKRDE